MIWKAFVRTTRPGFYALLIVVVLKHVLVKLLDQRLTASSSLQELNRAGTLLVNPTTATLTVG